jgi:hypothetical protein
MTNKISILILILLINLSFLNAQNEQVDTLQSRNKLNEKLSLKNPEGQEFWLCFMQNYKSTDNNKDNSLMLELFITSEEDANVTIELKALNYTKKIKVPALTVQNIKLSPLAELMSSEIIEHGMGVHITADVPISVYGLNRRHQTTDTYLGLPTSVLGNEYRIMSFTMSSPLMPEFAIVATEDNTTISIIPTVETLGGRKANQMFSVQLNKGDAYQVIAKPSGLFFDKIDFTGTKVISNKPISVFGGHQCAYVPAPPPVITACNHLVEQIPPTSSWGQHYFIGKLQKRSKYTWRALADLDSTKLFVNSKLVKILKAGETYEAQEKEDIQVKADKPILVSQYSQGYKNGDSIGDPCMILISPTQQFLRRYRFATPVNGFWEHFVSVVVPTKAINTIRLNGNSVDSSLFRQIGITRYSIGTIKVPFGTHSLIGAMPFGMYSYGFGYSTDGFDAYGTMGGQSFIEWEPALDTLAPIVELKVEKNSISGIASDDRDDDTGIDRIELIENQNFDLSSPKFASGVPQINFSLNPMAQSPARAVLKVNDLAMNETFYTICYQFDNTQGKFVFSISEGAKAECDVIDGTQVGLFWSPSFVFHNANFTTSGEVNSQVPITERELGRFNSASAINNSLGVAITHKIYQKLYGTGKLVFEKYNGILEAPDLTIGSTRNPETNQIEPYQEGRFLALDNSYASIELQGDYRFASMFYGIFGTSFTLAFNKSISYETKILQPSYLEFPIPLKRQLLDSYPTELSSLKSLNIGFYGGLGITYPIKYNFSVFFESYYKYFPSSIIDDGNWNISRFSILFGAKYVLSNQSLW